MCGCVWQTLKGRFTVLLPLDPTKHRRDRNRARAHGGYDDKTGPSPSFAVPPVPELGEFRFVYVYYSSICHAFW